jgi:transcription elongation GreA/GreB family factor
MSRAFIKESDGSELDELPELAVSPHRNLVTPSGLAQMEAALARLEADLAAARVEGDRYAVARIERDLRYWRRRRGSAELVATEEVTARRVRFGSRVTLRDRSGAPLTYRIVGEDESDPKVGLISYVSPLAEQMLGCEVGDLVDLRDGLAEVVAVE